MRATHNTGFLLQHLAFTLSRQNEHLLQEKLGLGFSQFKILNVLRQNPHVQQRDIANALGQTEASVSRQIKLMIKMGLLQSTTNPANRRQHITAPTAKGDRKAEEATHLLNNFHLPMFDRLTDNEKAVLTKLLGLMHECVCQSGKLGSCDKPFNV